MFAADRKASYKLPPTTIRDKLVSQEMRRTKALEEQKCRRAQKIDSSRQLDLFADLSLAGASDDEVEGGTARGIAEDGAEEDEDDRAKRSLAVASVAAYATMLQKPSEGSTMSGGAGEMRPRQRYANEGVVQPFVSTSTTHPYTFQQSHTSASTHLTFPTADIDLDPIGANTTSTPSTHSPTKQARKRGGKSSHKRRSEASKAGGLRGSTKWADKCMYAELLEMSGDALWSCATADAMGMGSEDRNHLDGDAADGLPRDLETGWVAVGPVPVGKRCLAVTHNQSAGVAGVVPNTTLRSRLLGKSLLARFPSALPPLTVMDCILDENWRQNGILHVLDVVRWKGQDVGDCEAGFRFWWRNTRLAELSQTPPPSFHLVPPSGSKSTASKANEQTPTKGEDQQQQYQFPYPTTFLPVPYYTTTALGDLDSHIIPAARSVRQVNVSLPAPLSVVTSKLDHPALRTPTNCGQEDETGAGMEIEHPYFDFRASSTSNVVNTNFKFGSEPTNGAANGYDKQLTALAPASVLVRPDGLLLYVAEASYEPGTSPLSSWIPITGYDEDACAGEIGRAQKEGPLDLFQRLVKRRMTRRDLPSQLSLGLNYPAVQASHAADLRPAVGGDVDMDF